MEVMEDGNLMDKVLILIQRDMQYYNNKQTVLQEIICPGIVGGRLDFPRSASFAAVKLVLWWEEEFLAAYRKGSGFLQEVQHSENNAPSSGGCGGIVKASDPAKFISLITKSSDQLLEHLHILTQEALDHADLTVLTGTIGAAALLKNCLWCYLQTTNVSNPALPENELLQKSQKKYQEMGEALAERLLDLHCRLLSLYILQDADSLDWENEKPFCEAERGSYVIQMWWLYMQGTKEDLWTTVPPKMAQRVFSGMLNESLTILTVRYAQARPTEKRGQLYTVDISNLLFCISELLPSICNNSRDYLGSNLNGNTKLLRDIHAKCNELLICLLLRGAPLDVLYKVFKRGLDKMGVLKPKTSGPQPWVCFTSPQLIKSSEIISELNVLLSQPQPNWDLLLKVICMDNCSVTNLMLQVASNECSSEQYYSSSFIDKTKCNGFLCSGDGTCKSVETNSTFMSLRDYDNLFYSISYVILTVGNETDFYNYLLTVITRDKDWFTCFERKQMWNLKRPPWYRAILDLIKPILSPITETTINAIKTGASMYQACAIIISSLTQLWECTNLSMTKVSFQLQDLLPAAVTPMGKSALFQIVIAALYSEFLEKSETKKVRFEGEVTGGGDEALAIAEALCSIDEDNKHTEEIDEFLARAKECVEFEGEHAGCKRAEGNLQMLEILVSEVLTTEHGKNSLKILHHFIKNNSAWLLKSVMEGMKIGNIRNFNLSANVAKKETDKLLHTMFCIGDKQFDQMLVGQCAPNWQELFSTPMGLSSERVYGQICGRWEFRDPNISNRLEGNAVAFINSCLKHYSITTEEVTDQISKEVTKE